MSKTKPSGWIGVDFDGTLSHYVDWRHSKANGLGPPVKAMVGRVLGWLRDGWEVKVVTARAAHGPEAIEAVAAWCQAHLGARLEVTDRKDSRMAELWDDRCVRVEFNTGRMLCPSRVLDLSPADAPSPAAGGSVALGDGHVVLTRELPAEARDAIFKMLGQIPIVWAKRSGGTLRLPIAEVDATGGYVLDFEVEGADLVFRLRKVTEAKA